MHSSKYTATYMQRINDLIHIAQAVAISGESEVVSFAELREVGSRNTYKACVVFDHENIHHGNAAHLIPLAKAIQYIVVNKYVNLRERVLILAMDKECNVELLTKEVADERKAKKVKVTILELHSAIDEELQQVA